MTPLNPQSPIPESLNPRIRQSLAAPPFAHKWLGADSDPTQTQSRMHANQFVSFRVHSWFPRFRFRSVRRAQKICTKPYFQRHCNSGAIKNAGHPRDAIKNTHDFLEATLSIGFGVFRTKNAGAPGAIKNKGPTRATTPKMPMRRFGVSPIADFPDSSPRQAGFRRPNPAPQRRIADHSPKNYRSSTLCRFSPPNKDILVQTPDSRPIVIRHSSFVIRHSSYFVPSRSAGITHAPRIQSLRLGAHVPVTAEPSMISDSRKSPGRRRQAVVFISAAEPSADLHGASLIRAVHQAEPDVRFVGVAGPQMRDAGCEAIFDMTAHAAMAAGILKVAPYAWSMLRTCKSYLRTHPPDLAVVIDSPTLNLPVARYARRAKVPVLYYIAPQVWAWARGRVRRVRRRTNRLAVILPFEEGFFRSYGVAADYVGHPLFDSLARREVDAADVAALRRQGQPLIVILPGSRTHVVREVFPGQLEVAAAIHAVHPAAHFCISVANERARPVVEALLVNTSIPHSLHADENGLLLGAADFALVASGTATLETAYYHVPMVVMYNATRLGWYFFGKWVTCTKHLSIVNILAGREIVPEFMPFYRSTEPIKRAALDMLADPQRLADKRRELADMMSPLIRTGASENAARIALEMLNPP